MAKKEDEEDQESETVPNVTEYGFPVRPTSFGLRSQGIRESEWFYQVQADSACVAFFRLNVVIVLMIAEFIYLIETIRLSFSDDVKQRAEEKGLSDDVVRMWQAFSIMDAVLVGCAILWTLVIVLIIWRDFCCGFCIKSKAMDAKDPAWRAFLTLAGGSWAQGSNVLKFWLMIPEGTMWLVLDWDLDMRIFYGTRYALFAMWFFAGTFSRSKLNFEANNFVQLLNNVADVASKYSVWLLLNDGSNLYQALLVLTIMAHVIAPFMALCATGHFMILMSSQFRNDNFVRERLKAKGEFVAERELGLFKTAFSLINAYPMLVLSAVIAAQQDGSGNTAVAVVTSIISTILLSLNFFKLCQKGANKMEAVTDV